MSKFPISKLEYAYTENGMEYIEDASKSFKYFLDKSLTIPLVLADGDINVKHWRKKANIDKSVISKVFGRSESVEHYNAKMRISLMKEIEYEIQYKTTKLVHRPTSSKVEYRLPTGQIADVAFFNKEGGLMLCVEVYHTHKKSIEDIIKFNNINVIVYEYNIERGTMSAISSGKVNEEREKRIRKGRSFVQRNKLRIKLLERGIERADSKRRKIWTEYYKLKEEYESFSDKRNKEVIRDIESTKKEIKFHKNGGYRFRFGNEIARCEKRNKDIRSEIKSLKDRITKIEESEKEIRGRIAREYKDERKIKSEISKAN